MFEKTVLVVDDDDMNLKMVRFILSSEPYRVLSAKSGMEGLMMMQEHDDIDLVLLDIEMPIMSGIQVLELMRNEEKLSKLQVIFLTAIAKVTEVAEAGRLGAESYIVKPFVPDELLKRVKKALYP